MNPIEFLRTLYWGDRYCKEFTVDTANKTVKLQVNCISRIRDKSGEWNFYVDEDVYNAILVFTDVEKITVNQPNLFPNDQIYDVYAKTEHNGYYKFVIETSHVSDRNETIDLKLELIGRTVYLIDPRCPQNFITE